jgi:hypothetical protein
MNNPADTGTEEGRITKGPTLPSSPNPSGPTIEDPDTQLVVVVRRCLESDQAAPLVALGSVPHLSMGQQGPRRGPAQRLERGSTGRPDRPGSRTEGRPVRPLEEPRGSDHAPEGQARTIEKTNQPLYHAYLLKEQLRQVFHLRQPWRALRLLDDWLVWARRCRLLAFVKLAHSITEHRAGIEAALVHDLSNARVESSSP